MSYISNTKRSSSYTFNSFLRDLKLSVAGSELDFTEVPLRRAIILLSIPMVLEMIMESVFALADIFFVSRLGAGAVATVGITESMMTIIYSIGMGLGVGATALVARRTGEKDHAAASRTAMQAILTAMMVSLLFTLVGVFFSRDLLRLMGASAETIEEGHSYTAIMLGGNMVIMLLFIINAVFRSSGDAAISFRVLFLANLLNIILDPLLIFGLGSFEGFGVKGAAIATNMGRGIAVVYQLWLLFGGKHRVHISKSQIVVELRTIVQLVKLSLGAIGQNLIATSSWVILVSVITSLGEDVVAGYTIAIRLVIFILLPAWGLANAASTLVGQNLGAGKPEVAARAATKIGMVNMLLLGLVSLVFIFFPGIFIAFFIDPLSQPFVMQNGVECLRLVSIGFTMYALGMVMVQAINGAGDTSTPIWINIVAFWGMEIPLAFIFTRVAGLAIDGISYAIVISESMMALIALVIFRRGKWKEVKV